MIGQKNRINKNSKTDNIDTENIKKMKKKEDFTKRTKVDMKNQEDFAKHNRVAYKASSPTSFMYRKASVKINKKIFATTFLFIFLTLVSVFVSTTQIFATPAQNQGGQANSSASMADGLLQKTLLNAISQCITDGDLTKNSVSTNTAILYAGQGNPANAVLKRSGKVSDETAIKILYKYGAGNGINDGNLSCEQLLLGYSGNGGNFNSFNSLGGRLAPFGNLSHSKSESDINEFLEALGYVSSTGGGNFKCMSTTYSLSGNGVSDKGGPTNSICINTENGKIAPSNGTRMTSADVSASPGNGQQIQLGLDDKHERIELRIDTPSGGATCKASGPTAIKKSKSIFSAKGEDVEAFFKEFLSGIGNISNQASTGVFTGATTKDFDATAPCKTKTLKEANGGHNVTIGAEHAQISGGDTSSSNGAVKKFDHKGSVSQDKLAKYFFPNYTSNANVAELEKGYNWYHVLKNNFDGLAVDTTAGCTNTAPNSGSYLRYYREAKDDPSKKEIQYCVLDEAVLNKKANEDIMSSGPKGKVNSISSKSDEVIQQTPKEILNNLNNLDLPSICKADESFPLCQPTPIECQQDPSKPGCKDLAGGDEENSEQAACMQNAGALGWMLCPLLYGARDMVNGIFENAIEPLLRVHSSIVQSMGDSTGNSPIYSVWMFFRDIANIIFVIFLLFVIFSQVTGFGIDNYGIKKIMPKLIITAIIVNFSYLICGIAIDFSNLIGDGIKNIFENLAVQITQNTVGATDSAGISTIVTKVVAGIAAAAAAVGAGVAVAGAVTGIASGGALAILLPIFAFVGSAALAGFFALLMLGLRQALIIIMIALSPIAFVLYAIPNTAPLFKKWAKLFQVLLTLYPVYCLMVGGGFLAANIILMNSGSTAGGTVASGSTTTTTAGTTTGANSATASTTTGSASNALGDIFMQIVAGIISIAPYFMVPSMTRKAMSGFDGAVGAISNLQATAQKGSANLYKRVSESEPVKSSAENVTYGKLSRLANKYRNYSNRDLSNLSGAKRRRLARAIGAISKDSEQAATIGATLSAYRSTTNREGRERIALSAQKAVDKEQIAHIMSSYKNQNLSHDVAIERLNGMMGYDYSRHSDVENHNHDLELAAMQSHILSTKDGQRAYNTFLQRGVAQRDENGQVIRDANGDIQYAGTEGTERARAVLARDYVENHSDLSKKNQVSYSQMQLMQGSGSVENMSGSTKGENARMATMTSFRGAGRSNAATNLDVDDIDEIGNADMTELNNEYNNLSAQAQSNLQNVSRQIVYRAENDPTQLGNYSEEKRRFVNRRTNNGLDNISNRILVARDDRGRVISTSRFENRQSGQRGQGGQGGQNSP